MAQSFLPGKLLIWPCSTHLLHSRITYNPNRFAYRSFFPCDLIEHDTVHDLNANLRIVLTEWMQNLFLISSRYLFHLKSICWFVMEIIMWCYGRVIFRKAELNLWKMLRFEEGRWKVVMRWKKVMEEKQWVKSITNWWSLRRFRVWQRFPVDKDLTCRPFNDYIFNWCLNNACHTRQQPAAEGNLEN